MLQFVWKNLSVKTRIIYKPAKCISEETTTVQLANYVKRKPTEFSYLFIFDYFFYFLKTLFTEMNHFTNCQNRYNNNHSLETERIQIACL